MSILCSCFSKAKGGLKGKETGGSITPKSLPPINRNIFAEVKALNFDEGADNPYINVPEGPKSTMIRRRLSTTQRVEVQAQAKDFSANICRVGTKKGDEIELISAKAKQKHLPTLVLRPSQINKLVTPIEVPQDDMERTSLINTVGGFPVAKKKSSKTKDVKTENLRDNMSQIVESEKEWEESQTEEQSGVYKVVKKKIGTFRRKTSDLNSSEIQRPPKLTAFNSLHPMNKKSSNQLLTSVRESDKNPELTNIKSSVALETEKSLMPQSKTIMVTEEEKEDLPERIQKANIEERRVLENEFFESVKNNNADDISKSLYVVEITWVKQWIQYISKNGKIPDKISNKLLYKKYFMYGQKIHLSVDFYYMTERLWKFLFAIYGGGPIMKKRVQNGHATELIPKNQDLVVSDFEINSPNSKIPRVGSFSNYSQSSSKHNVFSPFKTAELQNQLDRSFQFNDSESSISRPSTGLSGLMNMSHHNGSLGATQIDFLKNLKRPDSRLTSTTMKGTIDYISVDQRVVPLENPSNYCYMNAVMQVLLGVKEFCLYFLDQEFKTITFQTQIIKKDYTLGIAKLVREVMTLEDHFDYLLPSFLHKLIERKFSSKLQHDAHEFLMFILSQLQDELNPGSKTEEARQFSRTNSNQSLYWKAYTKAHPSIVDQLFVGRMSQSVECKQCEKSSTQQIPFLDFSVSVMPNLQQSIETFLATERLDMEEMYSCDECQTKTNAKLSTKIINFPKYMIIHLKRFESLGAGGTSFKKNTKPVDYPLDIDMDEYCKQALESLGQFSLIGVVVHKGATSESGHYTSFTKRGDGRWWHCNDRQVQLVTNISHVLKAKKSAYILVYEKCEI